MNELSEHEVKLLLSAITAKQKRLRGSIRNNVKNITPENMEELTRMIRIRELQMMEYKDLKLNLQVLINKEERI